MNNYLNLDIPLGSYKKGQILNISLPSGSSEISYQEEEFTSNIIPIFTSAANVTNKYGIWSCAGAPEGTTYLMLDGDSSTYTDGGDDERSYRAYVGSVTSGDGTSFAIKPKTVVVQVHSSYNDAGNFTVCGYDAETATWDDISSSQQPSGTKTISITTDKFYKNIGIRWETGSTLAYLTSYVSFSITAGTIRWGTLTLEPLMRIYNPLLNVNDLGYKPINSSLIQGATYGLVYNGKSWDVAYPYKILQGSYTSTASISVDLGGRPKFLMVFNAGSTCVVGFISDNLSKKFVLDNSRNTGTSNTPSYTPGYNGSQGSISITDTGFTATEGFKTGNYIAVF